MAVRILHGERAGDLIDACMEEICTEALLWPHKRAFLIVPEQTKADMERRYLEVRRRLCRDLKTAGNMDEALMLVDVLSFHRFAHRILSEVGGVNRDLADPAMQSLLIHRVLNENREDFRVLSSVSQRIGFASAVESVLEDFYRYDITPEMLRQIDGDGKRPLFAEKMREMALLMERLEQLTDQLDCCEKVRPLSRLCKIIDEIVSFRKKGTIPWPHRRMEYLSDASVWIVGFGQTRNFTPEEQAVITRLSALCTKVTLTACADPETAERAGRQGSPTGNEVGSDAFYFGGQTIKLLKEAVPTAEITKISTSSPAAGEIRHLSQSFLRRERKPYGGKADGVARMLFSTATEELSFVAGKIRELVLIHGYRYKDITVVLCNPREYQSNLHAVFAEFGMDPFLDRRKKLSDTALMQFVVALLDMGVNGWSFSSLMQCVKSGMCHITREETDRLENYCLKHGLFKGYRIFEESNYLEEKDPAGPRVFGSVTRVLLPLRSVVQNLKAQPRCDGKAVVLSDFLSSYIGGDREDGGVGQIELLGKEWVEAGDHDAAIALVASWNELFKILERLTGPLGDMPLSLRNFRDTIVYAAEAAPAGAIPAFVDQVRITDVPRGFQRDSKVLFLVGAERDVFPNWVLSEGFLRGHEREMLAQSLEIRFPNRSKDGAYADFFTAYAILDCPSEKLYVSSLLSKEPSFVFRLIEDCLPNSTFLYHPEKDFHDPRLFSCDTLRRYALSLLSSEKKAEETKRNQAKALLRAYPDPETQRELKQDPCEIFLPKELMKERYETSVGMSVSQIEYYASCPFRHFASYVLHLKERERFEVDPRETGSVTHRIMELALEELIGELRTASDEAERNDVVESYAKKDFDKWAAELFEQACEKNSYLVSRDPAMRVASGYRMIAIARESLRAVTRGIQIGDYFPEETEWAYGSSASNPPIVIELPNQERRVLFAGVIDRVDVNRQTDSFRVLDYKTGDKYVDYRMMYAGLSVQLPAYVYAYQTANKDLIPDNAGYFILKNPVITVDPSDDRSPQEVADEGKGKEFSERRLGLEPEQLQLCAEHAVVRIRQSCEKLFDGFFPVRPVCAPGSSTRSVCSYCEYKAVCGIDPRKPPYERLRDLPEFESKDGKRPALKDRYINAVLRDLEQNQEDRMEDPTRRNDRSDKEGESQR
ncbi:MAG: PD-(D/E)XK nuclease family protein [Clostridiales bacterium]|nr:PD-(D/E)XK nuclease family protein [Clostridiales bacterium]